MSGVAHGLLDHLHVDAIGLEGALDPVGLDVPPKQLGELLGSCLQAQTSLLLEVVIGGHDRHFLHCQLPLGLWPLDFAEAHAQGLFDLVGAGLENSGGGGCGHRLAILLAANFDFFARDQLGSYGGVGELTSLHRGFDHVCEIPFQFN